MVSVEFEVKSVSEFTLELTCWLASVGLDTLVDGYLEVLPKVTVLLVMVAVEPSEDEKFG